MLMPFPRKALILFTVGIAVFAMSILTNLSGTVLPFAKDSMNLSLSMAGILPFAFFIAYAVMSIPAGCIHERHSARSMIITAFCFTALATLSFIVLPSYGVFLASLFIAGAGMSVVQVVINPLVRNVGGEEYFSFYLIFGQLVYGAGSILSPLIFSYLITRLNAGNLSNPIIALIRVLTPPTMPWISIYWVCMIACIFVLLLLFLIKFPKMEMNSEDKIGGLKVLVKLLKDRKVWLFFFGIFAYAGVEQGVSNWMTKFLETYHGLNPETSGAVILSRFWLCISLGGGLGVILILLMSVKKMLGIFALIAMILLGLSLFGSADIVIYTFPLCGLFFAIMYPSILSLGMNSILEHHGALSGILCTGICGAAVISLLIGFLGDLIGLKLAMSIIFVPLFYVLFISIWAKPIIKNKKFF